MQSIVYHQMMHRLRRYDVFRFAQNDVAPLRSAMMRCLPLCARRHTSLGETVIIGEANIICQRQTSFKKRTFVLEDKSAFFVGGSGWIRTTEVSDNRFTVCPLWPLGKSPIWSWWTESNHQPADYKSAALPLSHTSIFSWLSVAFSRRLWYYTTRKAVCQHLFEKFLKFF